MSHFHFVTDPNTYCPACKRATRTDAALLDHNLGCSHDGERSYKLAVNVPARTVEAAKIRQGAGVKASGGA